MSTSKVHYADVVEDGEYFCSGPHCGFFVSSEVADLIKAAESGEITGPEGEPVAEIHHSVCDDLSRKVWSK